MAKNNVASTQQHLDIEDIKDDLVILKNGNIAMVMETSSLNFDLLSESEQDVRIMSFASLLNSLHFSMQIVIRTERADVNDYIEKLIKQRDEHISLALKKQTEIYIKFVQNLTTKVEILNKRFFVVITAAFSPISKNNSLTDLLFAKPHKSNGYINLEKAKVDLNPKKEFLTKQFKKVGMNAAQLTNDQLIQLYYSIYDPDKVGIKRVDISEAGYTTGVVEPLTTSLVDELTAGLK